MRFLILAAMAAVTVTATATVEAKKSNPDRDKQVICRRGSDAALGSHMPRPRVCKTRAEWRQVESTTDRELREYNERNQNTAPQTVGSASPS